MIGITLTDVALIGVVSLIVVGRNVGTVTLVSVWIPLIPLISRITIRVALIVRVVFVLHLLI